MARRNRSLIDSGSGSRSFKIFVDSVPVAASEKEIREVFEQYDRIIGFEFVKNEVKFVNLVGCFITYNTLEAANRAINAFHGNFTHNKKKFHISVTHCNEASDGVSLKMACDGVRKYLSKDEDSTRRNDTKKQMRDVIWKIAGNGCATAFHDFMNQVKDCDNEELKDLPKGVKTRIKLIKDGSLTINNTCQLIMDNIADDTRKQKKEAQEQEKSKRKKKK